MIRIRNVRLSPHEDESCLKSKCEKKLGFGISSYTIRKKSLDARRKGDVHFLYTLDVICKNEERVLKQVSSADIFAHSEEEYKIPEGKPSETRPIVVGFGPAGMFAALALAEAGFKPLVIERGEDADSRKESVERFHKFGLLNEESNVQFGEGGAGTFSDGKLTTSNSDVRIGYILKQLVKYGAQKNILYDAKPHIGTDVLINVVKGIRERIQSLGGEVKFNSKLTDVKISDGRLKGIEINGNEFIECEKLILALGHSARDTFEMLLKRGLPMEQKAFAMGVRIEHSQKFINEAQYGKFAKYLPAADYKLICHLPSGSSAHTFCMCPGGYVMASASEKGGIVTNGASESKRDGTNANAAILVPLKPNQFPSSDILSGALWQREIERSCFVAGGENYFAPCQSAKDFINGITTKNFGSVTPTYRPGVTFSNLNNVLPTEITSVLKEALLEFDKRIPNYADENAILTAPETRSTSPVKMPRNELRESPIIGIFPCGEGAGFAGGIMSAAVDGIKCAESIILY
ncbi:MAG: hypothetical protein E7614_02365 [Ruminococcaceae bacterium]|nr:hypothetical protein [Oscillospiraceae bacterium]